MSTGDNVLSFREYAKANNYPLVDVATWQSDTGEAFSKALLLDINIVTIAATGVVGLRSLSVTGNKLTVTFGDTADSFSALFTITLNVEPTVTEYVLPLVDQLDRRVGRAVIDAATAYLLINTTQQTHNFDPVSHAIVPHRVTVIGAEDTVTVEVDGHLFAGAIDVIGEGSINLTKGAVAMAGDPYLGLTAADWQLRRRSLRKLNGVTGQTAQAAMVQSLNVGGNDALRVTVRNGGLHFSLSGVSE